MFAQLFYPVGGQRPVRTEARGSTQASERSLHRWCGHFSTGSDSRPVATQVMVIQPIQGWRDLALPIPEPRFSWSSQVRRNLRHSGLVFQKETCSGTSSALRIGTRSDLPTGIAGSLPALHGDSGDGAGHSPAPNQGQLHVGVAQAWLRCCLPRMQESDSRCGWIGRADEFPERMQA